LDVSWDFSVTFEVGDSWSTENEGLWGEFVRTEEFGALVGDVLNGAVEVVETFEGDADVLLVVELVLEGGSFVLALG
jgi:hypothetical protein